MAIVNGSGKLYILKADGTKQEIGAVASWALESPDLPQLQVVTFEIEGWFDLDELEALSKSIDRAAIQQYIDDRHSHAGGAT